MKKKIGRGAVLVTRLAGVAALLLGLLIWFGQAGAVLHAHMGSGALMVLGLWVLAALRFNATPGIAAFAVVWGLLVPAVGIGQLGLLPGDLHWLIQLVHLAIGLSSLYLAERLAGAVRRETVRTA